MGDPKTIGFPRKIRQVLDEFGVSHCDDVSGDQGRFWLTCDMLVSSTFSEIDANDIQSDIHYGTRN